MDSSPQSNMVDVLDVHDINMKTLALAAAEKNEEEAAAEEEKDSTHPEIIIISDDESPTEEGGVEISQPRVNQRGVVRRRWTISEDCTLVRLICFRRFQFIWKSIADEIPGRSSDSCRIRWQKLMNYEDQHTKFRWSRLAQFLPATVTREYMFDHWRRHVMSNRRYRFSVTAFVDHPVGTNSPVQNNEGIVNSAQIVGPTITYPIPGQGSEVITSGDENVVGNTSKALATTSSNLSFVGASLDLNLNLPLDSQTSSITFYDFLGDKSY
ncbi:homeodomain-like protein [Tanacetum coccineum]